MGGGEKWIEHLGRRCGRGRRWKRIPVSVHQFYGIILMRGLERAQSQTPSNKDSRRSERSSHHSDHDMRSEREETPPTAPTPRRSSRLKRIDATAEESTPKSKTSKGKGAASVRKAAVETTTPKDMPRKTRRTTAEKATSPEAPPPVPPVPTITETAPSPSEEKSRSSTYEPRAGGDLPRGSSSLRARSDVTKRTHTGAASYNSSRAGSPSTGGRYSAREEDLPPMEDLEHAKIPLPSFSGINFGNLSSVSAPAELPKAPAGKTETGARNRLDRTPQTPQQAGSLNVPSASRLSGGPINRMNGGISTRPRSSSPLAAGSVVAQPQSPPTIEAPSQAPAQPPSDGFFRLTPMNGKLAPPAKPASSFFGGLSEPPSDGPKKSLGFGMGKPSSSSATEKEVSTTTSGVPDFFGTKSNTSSGTSTPIPPPAPFNFGLPAKAVEPAPTFSFGAKPAQSAEVLSKANGDEKANGDTDKPAKESTATPFSFDPAQSAKSGLSSTPAFLFGAAKPAEAPKPAFSFGTPSTSPAPQQSAESSKPANSFGGTASTDVLNTSSEGSKPAFSFGRSSAATPKLKAADEAVKPAFSFGTSSSTSAPNAAETPASLFGRFNFNKPAELVTSATPSNGTAPSFAFGQANGGSASGRGKVNGTADGTTANPFSPGRSSGAASAATPFSFGTPSAPSQPNATSAPTSGFGAPAGPPTSTSFSFGSTASVTPNDPFATSSTPQPAPTSTPAPSFSFASGNTSAIPASSNPFATSQPQASASSSNGFGFSFNQNSNPTQTLTPTTPSFAFGQSNPVPPTPPTPPTNQAFSFGTPSSSHAQPAFSFGAQPVSTTPQAPPPTFGFGTANNALRFGSPAPATAGTEGGFSMGMSPVAPTPGSPSGRIIKPLRRGTKR